ncbi:MAG: hypothetical protein QOK24_2714 [Verrucomicrobiota bacterium]|jgi:hypothetical protein
MSYEGEFAKYRSVQRLVNNPHVTELQKRCKIAPAAESGELPLDQRCLIDSASLGEDGPRPELVVAIDGSHVEVPVRNGFPGAEVSYVTCAAVILDMKRLRHADENRPIDPLEFKKTENAGCIDAALPSTNMIKDGCGNASESFREAFFDLLGRKDFTLGETTLKDTYQAIMGSPPQGRIKCPSQSETGCDQFYRYAPEVSKCPCLLETKLFSTDWLRVHEGFGPANNGAVFGEVIQVIERLMIVHFLRYLESTRQLSVLARCGLMVDGPLAMFGHPAELKDKIEAEIRRINAAAAGFTRGLDILVLGIEKTGAFVDHFTQLDMNRSGSAGRIPRGTAILLDDAYIKKHIVPSDSKKQYGRDTYFGRKFFYKTKRGHLVVANLPFLADAHKNLKTALPSQFPRLATATRLLDEVSSSRYPNAMMPLVSAHAEAAIPLNLGVKVLKQLAQQNIQQ